MINTARKCRARLVVMCAAGLVIAAPPVAARNWPNWRGPSSNGVSTESGLATTWSASENVAWKISLAGLGASSPIVWNDRVFVTSQIGRSAIAGEGGHPQLAREEGALAARESSMGVRRPESDKTGTDVLLVVEAFSRIDGKRLWVHHTKAVAPFSPGHEKHNLATSTPATDGERVYAWFGNGQIVALDMEGRVVWTRHLGAEYAPYETLWGHGSSPTIYGDLVILLNDHLKDAYLLAVDARTGRERWKVDRDGSRVSHSTPLVIRHAQGDELVVNSSARIDAYDPSSGKPLWHTGDERQTPVPSPVFHDGRIFLSRGYRSSDYMAIRPGGRGDVTATHIEWQAPSAASYVPSILYYDGLLYMTNDVGILTCADARTGERVWRHRLDGVFFASPVGADGKVYLVSEAGETFVLRAGREPQVLARNAVGERVLASPAISQGRIFLRTDGTLFALGR